MQAVVAAPILQIRNSRLREVASDVLAGRGCRTSPQPAVMQKTQDTWGAPLLRKINPELDEESWELRASL